MRVQIIGAGLMGCAIANALYDDGHEVGLYDANKHFSGWAICTGKVFPAKSNTPLAERLNRGFDWYEETWNRVQNELPGGRQQDVFENCVSSMMEVVKYKDPAAQYKRLSQTEIREYVRFHIDVRLFGYQLHASRFVAQTRTFYPEWVTMPDLTINATGAWDKELKKPSVVAVRGVVAEITIRNAPPEAAFHWPAKGMYYVPIPGQPDRYVYGTVMVPDSSMAGAKMKDIEHLTKSEDAVLMADWLRENYDAKVVMTGASGSISSGYRPWVRGYVPGYFHWNENTNTLHVNGLYQSGAQMCFWAAEQVATAAQFGVGPDNVLQDMGSEYNFSTKESV